MSRMVEIDDCFVNADHVLFVKAAYSPSPTFRCTLFLTGGRELQCSLWPRDVAKAIEEASAA